MRKIFLVAGIILALSAEVLKTYFIIPFSFSQNINAVEVAWFFYHNIVWLRIIALLLIAYSSFYIFQKGKIWKRVVLTCGIILYGALIVFSNTYLKASEKYQPLLTKKFALRAWNKISTDKQVIGVSINGEAKAYPIQLVGYHHYVSDTIGNTPVIITYCTICRTARAYSLKIKGKPDKFNLVGVNQFNAILEDSSTKSWWQQATGMAIAGPLKGEKLEEIPFRQASLFSWLLQHPTSGVLQPDDVYAPQYALLESYDKSSFKGNIVQIDSTTYKAKSLVVGIANKSAGKAYDWNKLGYVKVLEDSLPGTAILITVEKDNTSFHVWKRKVKDQVLRFEKTDNADKIKDVNTSSVWNMNGECMEGELKGTRLSEVQSYQETRESWENFHPSSEETDISTQ